MTSGPAGDPTTTAGTRITAVAAVVLGIAGLVAGTVLWVELIRADDGPAGAGIGVLVLLVVCFVALADVILGVVAWRYAAHPLALLPACLGLVTGLGPLLLLFSL